MYYLPNITFRLCFFFLKQINNARVPLKTAVFVSILYVLLVAVHTTSQDIVRKTSSIRGQHLRVIATEVAVLILFSYYS